MENPRLDPGERLDLTQQWDDPMHEAMYRAVRYGKVTLSTGDVDVTIDYTDR